MKKNTKMTIVQENDHYINEKGLSFLYKYRMLNKIETQIKSKIICTIGKLIVGMKLIRQGPKTQSVEAMGKLVEAGMNVVRMNFSHGTHDVYYFLLFLMK